MGTLGIPEIIMLGLTIIPVILWIVALLDIVKSRFSDNNKIVWLLIVIFLPVLGAIIYFLVGRGQKI